MNITSYKATNIDWDAPDDIKEELPDEVEIPLKQFSEDCTDIYDYASEYLSDKTGYCPFEFDLNNLPERNAMLDKDMNVISIYAPDLVISNGEQYYKISEGTGDNLSEEDINDGYIDYIYYNLYENKKNLENDEELTGGMVMLKKYYRDLTNNEILDLVFGIEELNPKEWDLVTFD